MLPKYKYLLTYRYSEMIHDLTVPFCEKWIDWKSRTRDQMVQAARSGKQNIVEGIGQSHISTKGEIKLLGVAKASLEELISDYEDILRQKNLTIWPKNDPRIMSFRELGLKLSNISNLSGLGNLKVKPVLPPNLEEAANLLLTFCHMATFLLDKQIKATEDKFIKDGGFSENLLRRRLDYRNKMG